MTSKPKKILITTSRNPAEASRRFAKVLQVLLPNSSYLNRGNMNEIVLLETARKEQCDFLYLVFSQTTAVDKLVIRKIQNERFEEIDQYLKILQFLDNKMFGFDRIPESGPISTSVAAGQVNRRVIDFFEKYLDLQLGEKLPIWMAIDQPTNKSSTYIALIDALTQKRFLFIEVQVKKMKKDL